MSEGLEETGAAAVHQDAIDFGGRPIPDVRGRAMAAHEGDLIDQDL